MLNRYKNRIQTPPNGQGKRRLRDSSVIQIQEGAHV
jgi:hypothetical protein